MHVLQLLPELNVGGVERGTLEISAALVEAGYRSTVVSAGGRLVAELEAAGSRHIELPVQRKSVSGLREAARLGKLLGSLRPDIVHVRSRWPAWLLRLALWRNAPTLRPAVVTTVHGLYSVNRYSAIMTRGERVIVISEAVRRYVLDNYPNTSAERLRLIHRGVDQKYFSADFRPSEKWLAATQAEFPGLQGRRLLVLPGRLTRWKGAETFVRMVAALPAELSDVVGVIVGGAEAGSFAGELERLIEHLNVQDRVVLAGHRSDMREWLATATLAFNLSTHPEPFGRTVIEALSLGTPVVAYDSGGPAETLRACFPAGLVANADSLQGRVRSLLIDGAPAVAPCPFSLQAMQQKTLVVYRELV